MFSSSTFIDFKVQMTWHLRQPEFKMHRKWPDRFDTEPARPRSLQQHDTAKNKVVKKTSGIIWKATTQFPASSISHLISNLITMWWLHVITCGQQHLSLISDNVLKVKTRSCVSQVFNARACSFPGQKLLNRYKTWYSINQSQDKVLWDAARH